MITSHSKYFKTCKYFEVQGHLSGNFSADHDDRALNFCTQFLLDQMPFYPIENIILKGLVKILLDQDGRLNKFCPIICVFARSYDR